MPSSPRVIDRIQDQADFIGSLTDGYFLSYSSSTGKFSLAQAGSSSAPYVLTMTGADGECAHGGYFWPDGSTTGASTSLGSSFFWEAWLKPTVGGYWICDGYGGNHVLLDGPITLPGPFTGNVWTGAATVSYTGTCSVAAGEWVHRALAWDGTNLYSYVNGVCDAKIALSTRQPLAWSGGNGMLFIGSHTHQGMGGSYAAVRGFDRGNSPRSGGTYEWAFAPWRSFPAVSGQSSSFPDFLMAFNAPGLLSDRSPRGVSHQSPGGTFDATARTFHHAYLLCSQVGTIPGDSQPIKTAGVNYPAWSQDANCPYGQSDYTLLPAETIPSPASAPGSVVCYDSFGRRNQTLAFQATPSLGSTEAGSAGVKAWTDHGALTGFFATRSASHGILGGKVVYLETVPCTVSFDSGISDVDVRVKRVTGTGLNGWVTLVFRLTSKDNYLHCWFPGSDGGNKLYLGKVVAGSYSALYNVTQPNSTWDTLRVTAVGSTIKLYIGSSGVFTQAGTDQTETFNQSATRVGFGFTGQFSLYSSLARHDDIAVFAG